MLPTFVIGLREGLEAALIVGIIATFLAQQGRRDAFRPMWTGVGIAIALCIGVAVALRITEDNLPQRQQEGLATIVALLAVAMVTSMIIWMRRHARGLKGDLEGKAAAALVGGSVGTLVLMAFLAVLREGFETAVFLLAAFQAAREPVAAGGGAVLGLVLAAAIGYGIYRGGVRLNLERFFRFTGFVLVLVAGGLLATAAHTAHEAGWLAAGQAEVFNLRWLVDPGSVRSALLTGMLGIQPEPVVAEVVVWLAYVIPMGILVLWPSRPSSARRLANTPVAVAVGAALTRSSLRPERSPHLVGTCGALRALGRHPHQRGDGRGDLVLTRVGLDGHAVRPAADHDRALPGMSSASASRLSASSSSSIFSLMRTTSTGAFLGVDERGARLGGLLALGSRDRVAVRARGRVAEQLDELLLDVGRDRVLPAVGLAVDLLPLEADDVDEEALGEPVAAHDGRGEVAALLGEPQAAVVHELGVATADEAVDLLRDRRGGDLQPLDEPGPDGGDALLLELEDRLEVLLGGIVHLGHGGLSVPLLGLALSGPECQHGLALRQTEC